MLYSDVKNELKSVGLTGLNDKEVKALYDAYPKEIIQQCSMAIVLKILWYCDDMHTVNDAMNTMQALHELCSAFITTKITSKNSYIIDEIVMRYFFPSIETSISRRKNV